MIQGNWLGQFGSNGYALCAFNEDTSDLISLPSYISGITQTGGTSQHIGDDSDSYTHLLDPRALTSPTSLRRAVGFWKVDSGSLEIAVQPNETISFNLSVYANCANQSFEAPSESEPFLLRYDEAVTRDLMFRVTDLTSIREYRLPNVAAGVWVTFSVQGDSTENGRILVEVVPEGSSTAAISAIAFDPYDNHSVSYTRSMHNTVTSVTDGFGNNALMHYYPNGRLSSVKDALGNQTQLYYDDANQNLTHIQDANGNMTIRTFDDNSNILSTTDQNGNVTNFEYDGKNRLIAVIDPNKFRRTIDYDENGNISKFTDANGHYVTYTYTSSNRLHTVTDPLSNQTVLTYDAAGNVSTVTDRLGRILTYAYDDDNRLSSITLPDGSLVTYEYDALGRMRAATTPNGNQATVSDINRTGLANWIPNAGAEQADPNDPTSPLYWISSGSGDWDASNVHSGSYSLKLAAEGGTAYWSQSQIPFPAGATALFDFWAATDGDASTTSVQAEFISRDVYGRPSDATSLSDRYAGDHPVPFTAEVLPDTSWQDIPTQRFVPVPGNAQTPMNGLEELRLHASGSAGKSAWFDDLTLHMLSTAYSYDAASRLVEAIAPDGARTRFIRDVFGRVVRVEDAQGRTVSMLYDSLDRLVQVTDALGNVATSTYDAMDNLATFTDFNGNTTSYAYEGSCVTVNSSSGKTCE